jgi:DNA-binding transcriptional LysR family regulator
MLDVHQLNVFLAAAETLNFTRAARQLHMTQPSVSQHIQVLERHFNTHLFIRNGRNLVLTDAGYSLIPLAREAVTISIRIDETMESLKGAIFGHLIVACSTTPGKYILPNLLAQFHRKYPLVRVTCQVFPQVEALQSLISGDVHFALYSLENSGLIDLDVLSFITDPIILIAPLDHPWAERKEIEADELLDGDFIMRETSSGTYESLRDALAQQNITIGELNTLITLGNAEAIALAVQEGIGVGFVSEMVVDRLCRETVAEIKIKGLIVQRSIYIGRNHRRPATAAQTAFWSFLNSLINEKTK